MIRNVSVTSALNIYRSAIQFALNVALARFLAPSDFGEVAFVLPITLLILLLGDFGITVATVRSNASPREAGAAATICMSFGIAIFALSVVLHQAGVFASWPGQTPQLVLAFALVATIAMAAIIPRAMLERQLAYGRLAVIETIGNTTAFLAAVAAAWHGMGVWSFAVYHLTMQIIRATLFWTYARGTLQVNFHWQLAKALMGFGGWVAAFNVVNYCARNLDNYIIGTLLGTAQLGIYALAYQIMLVPLMAITWPASGVLLATLSRLRDQPDVLRNSHLAMVRLTAMVTFPVMTLVALRGGLLFEVLLPERWHGLGPLLGRMALAGGLQSSTAFIGALFLVQGRVRQQLVSGIVATTLSLGTIALAAVFGGTLIAVSNAYLAITLVLSVAYYAGMAWLLKVRIGTVLQALTDGIACSIGGVIGVFAIEQVLPSGTPAIVHLLAVGLAFGSIAIGVMTSRHAAIRRSLGALRGAGNLAAS